MSKLNVIGIDLAKNIFQISCVDSTQRTEVLNKAIKRKDLLNFMRNQRKSRVFMEACGGAHYWARQIQLLGHEVHMIAPQFVKPFRKGHKTDANDALAIAEAGMRVDMRFVPLKTLEQQDVQAIHRVRERLIKQRTQIINQTHAILLEFGIASAKGQPALRRTVQLALENAENELSPVMRALLSEQMQEINVLNERLKQMDLQVSQLSRSISACALISELEGIGPVTATMLYSALGDCRAFKRGREASAYIGVTPKQFSSGGKANLMGIGRTRHVTLRAALVRGALAVIKMLGDKEDAKSQWLRELIARAGKNKAAVALVNKTVRTAWALMSKQETYDAHYRETVGA